MTDNALFNKCINPYNKKSLIKPPALQSGDKVAAISLSWGGASVFPHKYQAGKKQFEETFNLQVIETPNAYRTAQELAQSPQMRAEDLMWAFENPDIKAIIAIIGGDDSIRTIPYIDFDKIKHNPKIFMGYSDSTVTHFTCLKAGLSSIYGPTFMAGFAENCGIFDYMKSSVMKTLFSGNPIGTITPNNNGWTDDESLPWADLNSQNQKRPLKSSYPPKLLQGTNSVSGHLIGGCIEVLEMIKGTEIWPDIDYWNDAILFLETSEEAPSQDYVVRCMRNYAATGILERISGIVIGRPANVKEDLRRYDDAIIHVVSKECELNDMPILSQMDFGHTDPMFLIPYGLNATIDTKTQTLSINENAVI